MGYPWLSGLPVVRRTWLGSILGLARRRTVAYLVGSAIVVALVISVFAGHYALRNSVDPIWHDVSCVSGVVSLALLGLGTIVGLVQRLGASPSPGLRAAPLHSLLAVGALVFTSVHLVAVTFVKTLDVGWLQLLIPFTRWEAPIAQGLGVLAFYLMLTVIITGAMRRRLPPRWWRRVHRLGLPSVVLGCLHGVLAELPVGSGTSMALSASVVVVVIVLMVLPKVYPPVAVRRSVARAESGPGAPAPATLASLPTMPAVRPVVSVATTAPAATTTLAAPAAPVTAAASATTVLPAPASPAATAALADTASPAATAILAAPSVSAAPPLPAAATATAPAATPARSPQPTPTATECPTAIERTTATERPTAIERTAPECNLKMLITQATWEADGVISLELRSVDGAVLPAWSPGAHIRLVLPSGRLRRYSLYGEPHERDRYRVAVLRQESGQGGSREFHELLRVGGRLRVSEPSNVFPLKAAPGYLFVAGGIGITAILPMVRAVIGAGQPWRLVYAGRSRSRMAFLTEVNALHPFRVSVLPEDEVGRPDLDRIVEAQLPGTAVYGCGPSGMLDTLRRTVGPRSDLRLHIEAFTGAVVAPPTSNGAERAFTVRLRRSGHSVQVPSDRTVLDVVRALAPDLAGGCEEGFCGRCQVTVLDGEPDHRDALLSAAQRKRGCMLTCVSRAKSECLTLDA